MVYTMNHTVSDYSMVVMVIHSDNGWPMPHGMGGREWFLVYQITRIQQSYLHPKHVFCYVYTENMLHCERTYIWNSQNCWWEKMCQSWLHCFCIAGIKFIFANSEVATSWRKKMPAFVILTTNDYFNVDLCFHGTKQWSTVWKSSLYMHVREKKYISLIYTTKSLSLQVC